MIITLKKTKAQRRADYAEYLKSDHWREIRLAALIKADWKCNRCPAKDQLEVHHKIYRDSWFDSGVLDLEVLCHQCHDQHHTNQRIKPNSYHPVPGRGNKRRKRLIKRLKWQWRSDESWKRRSQN